MRGCELRVLVGTLVHSYNVDSTCKCKLYREIPAYMKKLARMSGDIESPIVILSRWQKREGESRGAGSV